MNACAHCCEDTKLATTQETEILDWEQQSEQSNHFTYQSFICLRFSRKDISTVTLLQEEGYLSNVTVSQRKMVGKPVRFEGS